MAIELGPVLLTGITAALLNQGITWLKDWRRDSASHKREQYNCSLAIAVSLERFAIECASCVAAARDELDEFDRTSAKEVLRTTAIPALELPEDVDWRWLGSDLASTVLALAPQVDYSNAYLGWLVQIKNLDDVCDECIRQAGTCGLAAWCLAERLRSRYGIPSAQYHLNGWDFLDRLSAATVMRLPPPGCA